MLWDAVRSLVCLHLFFGQNACFPGKKGRKIRREKLGKRKSAERELGCHSRRDRWLVLFFSSFFLACSQKWGKGNHGEWARKFNYPQQSKNYVGCNRGTADFLFPPKKSNWDDVIAIKTKLKVQTDTHIHDSIRQKIRLEYYGVPFFWVITPLVFSRNYLP